MKTRSRANTTVLNSSCIYQLPFFLLSLRSDPSAMQSSLPAGGTISSHLLPALSPEGGSRRRRRRRSTLPSSNASSPPDRISPLADDDDEEEEEERSLPPELLGIVVRSEYEKRAAALFLVPGIRFFLLLVPLPPTLYFPLSSLRRRHPHRTESESISLKPRRKKIPRPILPCRRRRKLVLRFALSPDPSRP